MSISQLLEQLEKIWGQFWNALYILYIFGEESQRWIAALLVKRTFGEKPLRWKGISVKTHPTVYSAKNTMNCNKNWQYFCKRYNHQQEECRTRIQENQPCTDSRGWKYWPKRYTTSEETTQKNVSPILALTSKVTPLRGNPADENNCNVMIENCAPYDITIETTSRDLWR